SEDDVWLCGDRWILFPMQSYNGFCGETPYSDKMNFLVMSFLLQVGGLPVMRLFSSKYPATQKLP
ncbi:MAG: hypothetical protein K2J58_06535, partial [Muribaculaceae bacterium]|nr:hypothetical protein [Muribaculaceae bacterium]